MKDTLKHALIMLVMAAVVGAHQYTASIDWTQLGKWSAIGSAAGAGMIYLWVKVETWLSSKA